jgi:hypothetical protein
LKEALAVWNEIKGWVSGPEIWLAAPWPYLTLALKAFDTFDDCCGIMVNAAQPSEPTLLQHPPFEIPPRIPYAVNYSLGAPGTAHLWTAQHPPDWVVMVPNLIHSLSPDAGTLRYLCVEDLKEVTVWRKAQDLPPIAGIYLQADVTKATDYEVWQEIIDAL